MNSIWTNLLLLHGYITPRDLAWRPDTAAKQVPRKVPAKAGHAILARCAVVWPRLIGPR